MQIMWSADTGPILTDDKGRPIEPPKPPTRPVPIGEYIAYLCARARYNDHVTDVANRAFTRSLQESLKE